MVSGLFSLCYDVWCCLVFLEFVCFVAGLIVGLVLCLFCFLIRFDFVLYSCFCFGLGVVLVY